MPRSVMAHSFSQVPRAKIPRSSFNRSHGVKTTFDADYLIPVLVDPVVPGDSYNVEMNFVARLATPLYPLMDNLVLESFFFFVPNRLVWDNWEKFCGAQEDPNDSIDYTIPVVSGSTARTGEGSLWDYFGLPLDNGAGAHVDPDDVTVSCLPWRGYQLIWNEWFRDQNLQNTKDVTTDNGPDILTTNTDTFGANDILATPIKRGKRHDYFTSSLPAPQKGTAATSAVTFTSDAWVKGIGIPTSETTSATYANIQESDGSTVTHAPYYDTVGDIVSIDADVQDGYPQIYADLSTGAATVGINDLRLAFQTQRLLERDARSGTRYNETILAHFGVVVPDFRVQRPEFLGGGSSPIAINQVQNNSGSSGDLGDLAAFGIVSGTHGFTKSFVEHGYIIGMVNVRGDITYHQGIERHWGWSTRYDHYYPVLSQLGEQSVLNREIYCQGDGATNDDNVFGYQERYAEMRYKPSRVTGLMNPNASGTLAAWHLAEDFTSLPTLGDTFIQAETETPLDRAIATPTEPHIIFDGYFSMKCARPMPLYGVPGNLDHF